MNSENIVPKNWNVAKRWRNNRKEWNEYRRERQHQYNPKLNAISKEASKLAGGYKVYRETVSYTHLTLPTIYSV